MTDKSWGYKILSKKSFNFYCRGDFKIDIKDIARELDSFREISVLKNGSITIYTQEEWLVPAVKNMVRLAHRIDKV